MYRIKKRKTGTVAALLANRERLFHAQDLRVLWGTEKSATLHTTITRLCRRGVLHRIQKGMYASVPIADLDPVMLGLRALHGYSYVSGETVLARAGLINAHPATITLMGSVSRRFVIAGHRYRVRRLRDAFLFNPAGIVDVDGVPTATPERAVADTLFFNPRAHFDAPIPWSRVQTLQKVLGYPVYAPHPAPR